MGTWESEISAKFIQYFGMYLDEHPLGVVLGEGGFLRLAPGLIRAPDVSFVSYEQMPGGKCPKGAIAGLFPNLAVEVLCPGNTKKEITRKLREYFGYGTELAWVVNPRRRTVDVHTSPGKKRRLLEGEQLDGGDILPGFSLLIAKVFPPNE